jgi:hypothetical protein
MGLLSGAISAQRLTICNGAPDSVEGQLEHVKGGMEIPPVAVKGEHACLCSPVGFSVEPTYDQVLPTGNRWVHLGVRVITDDIPAAALRAERARLTQIALQGSITRFLSRAQKKNVQAEARENMERKRARLEFRRVRHFEVLFDLETRYMYVPQGDAARRQADLAVSLSFGVSAPPEQLPTEDLHGTLQSLKPCGFNGGGGVRPTWSPVEPVWVLNEFAVWLWWRATTAQPVILPDSELTVAVSSFLACQDPEGSRGICTVKTHLAGMAPEARLCLREGKLPRRLNLAVSASADPATAYTFVFSPDTWNISGLSIIDGESGTRDTQIDRLVHRWRGLDQVHFAMRRAFFAFVEIRANARLWGEQLEHIRAWVADEN